MCCDPLAWFSIGVWTTITIYYAWRLYGLLRTRDR